MLRTTSTNATMIATPGTVLAWEFTSRIASIAWAKVATNRPMAI